MNKKSKGKYSKILRNRQQQIGHRLRKKQWKDQPDPVMKGSNIHYEMSGKIQAINCGGIGVLHQMVKKMGLVKEIDSNLKLLKTHVPYHESDHVLNIAYNILAGG
ncbi:MAG: IS1380 family transposase, partial [bacterium]